MTDFDAATVREQMARAFVGGQLPALPGIKLTEHDREGAAAALPIAVQAVTDAVRALHSIPHWCQGASGEEEWFEADTEGRRRCPTLQLCDEIDKAAGVHR